LLRTGHVRLAIARFLEVIDAERDAHAAAARCIVMSVAVVGRQQGVGAADEIEPGLARAEPDLARHLGRGGGDLERLVQHLGRPPLLAQHQQRIGEPAGVDDRVVPVACGWSDVGSWHAVWELSDKDGQGNAARGVAVFEDSRNCNVTTDRALVALEGVDDLVVVATQDAVLVSRQKDANGLKRLVAKLKTVAPQVTEDHIKVHRPWGSYQSVDNGDRHQVKRIIVKPGGRLSLQKHHHRSEHWIVVRGAARVTVNELVKTVHENESIYIPIGAVHRLENPGKISLELIEVQTGSYLGEDDIIRIEDDYQRA